MELAQFGDLMRVLAKGLEEYTREQNEKHSATEEKLKETLPIIEQIKAKPRVKAKGIFLPVYFLQKVLTVLFFFLQISNQYKILYRRYIRKATPCLRII